MAPRKRKLSQDAVHPDPTRYTSAELKAIEELCENLNRRLENGRSLHLSLIHMGLMDAWSIKLLIRLLKREIANASARPVSFPIPEPEGG
jgi:hypothetical protein